MIVSIDIETTGLCPDKHFVLEIAAVWYKGKVLNTVHCYVVHEEVIGNLYALNMNKEAIQRLIERDSRFTYLKPDEVKEFLDRNLPKEQYTVAGANLANFDLRFLRKLGWKPNCHHRIMDVGNLYYDWVLDGDELPSVQTCLKRAGIPGNVKHNAVDDAKDVLRLIGAKR